MRRAGWRPGDYVIVGLIVVGHAADIPLARRGHDSVSACSRRWLWFWLLFGIHAARPGCRLDMWRIGRGPWDRYRLRWASTD